jgi:hypothetical protein
MHPQDCIRERVAEKEKDRGLSAKKGGVIHHTVSGNAEANPNQKTCGQVLDLLVPVS